MKPTRRRSEIRVVDADGIVHIGQGDGLALAVRVLAAQHTADPTGDVAALSGLSLADVPAHLRGEVEERVTLTPAGWAAAYRQRQAETGRGS